MREIVHIQAGQCGNQIGAKVCTYLNIKGFFFSKSGIMYRLHTKIFHLLYKISKRKGERQFKL